MLRGGIEERRLWCIKKKTCILTSGCLYSIIPPCSPGVPRCPVTWDLLSLAELVSGLMTVLTALLSLLGVLLKEKARPTYKPQKIR